VERLRLLDLGGVGLCDGIGLGICGENVGFRLGVGVEDGISPCATRDSPEHRVAGLGVTCHEPPVAA
jgi:hypothetical protein